MSRGTLAWISLSLVVMAAGCRMCASPYDDCGPTFTGQCAEDCAPMARAGSILSGYFPPTHADEFPPDQVPNLPDLPDDEILPPEAAASMTDTDSELVADAEPVTVGDLEEAPPEITLAVEEVRPSQSHGWTAAKPAETRLE
ncbi:MAG TPA: hypothetical protein VMY37_32655 [Thermoguttaceae bacterium]|nr:hypothetical protein [Thermoguttaceae bacterium]